MEAVTRVAEPYARTPSLTILLQDNVGLGVLCDKLSFFFQLQIRPYAILASYSQVHPLAVPNALGWNREFFALGSALTHKSPWLGEVALETTGNWKSVLQVLVPVRAHRLQPHHYCVGKVSTRRGICKGGGGSIGPVQEHISDIFVSCNPIKCCWGILTWNSICRREHKYQIEEENSQKE